MREQPMKVPCLLMVRHSARPQPTGQRHFVKLLMGRQQPYRQEPEQLLIEQRRSKQRRLDGRVVMKQIEESKPLPVGRGTSALVWTKR